jgi:hypothetical protein
MIRIASFIAATVLASAAYAGETPSAPNAKVFFTNLRDGDTVSSPVTLNLNPAVERRASQFRSSLSTY